MELLLIITGVIIALITFFVFFWNSKKAPPKKSIGDTTFQDQSTSINWQLVNEEILTEFQAILSQTSTKQHRSRGTNDEIPEQKHESNEDLDDVDSPSFAQTRGLFNSDILPDEKVAIVIDNGSGIIKAGFAGENAPRTEFPTVVGRNEGFYPLFGSGKCYIGNNAQNHPGNLMFECPIERGVVTNWDDMEKIWQYVFDSELCVDPSEQPVLLTEAAGNTKSNREKMAEIMFEKFNTPSIYIAVQPVLSLFASGRTTGIVIESGDGVTQIAPVEQGVVLKQACLSVDLAGRDLTEYMRNMLSDRGHCFKTMREKNIVHDIKKKRCRVAIDFEQAMKMDPSTLEESHELPDGQIINIGDERFRCPEVLFDPSLFLRKGCGIHKNTYNSIMKCDTDLQQRLFSNIVLSGGSTMFRGFKERMEKEMKSLVPGTTTIKITAPQDRKYPAWIGGSILASTSSFQQMWISKQKYEESGP